MMDVSVAEIHEPEENTIDSIEPAEKDEWRRETVN